MLSLDAERLNFLDGVEHPETDIEDLLHYQTDTWNANNSTFSEYALVARRCGLSGVTEITRAVLGQFTTNVALDIAGGSNGAAMQELIAEGTIDTGIVTNLLDKRDDEAKNNSRLLHVEGDLIEQETWQRMFTTVMEATDNKGPTLITHRPCGALQYFSPTFYRGGLHLLLDTLQPGGLFFSQVPQSITRATDDERTALCNTLVEREDVEFVQASEYLSFNYSVLIGKAL